MYGETRGKTTESLKLDAVKCDTLLEREEKDKDGNTVKIPSKLSTYQAAVIEK